MKKYMFLVTLNDDTVFSIELQDNKNTRPADSLDTIRSKVKAIEFFELKSPLKPLWKLAK